MELLLFPLLAATVLHNLAVAREGAGCPFPYPTRRRRGTEMKPSRFLSIPLALAASACVGEAPVPVVASSDYDSVVRTGYFDGKDDPDDWRYPFITREQARGDLEVLDSLLEHHYAYNDADELDEDAVLAAISAALPPRIRVGDFAMQLQKALALSIDGHAPRIAGMTPEGEWERIENNPPGEHYFPFDLRSTGSRIVAFDAVERTLVDAAHPYLVAIDGLPVREWIEVAQSIIVQGSPQLRWRRGSRQLSNIGFLRMEAGRLAETTAVIALESEDRTLTAERTIELVGAPAAVRERYPLAEEARARVPDDIGYFRLRRMESDSAYIAAFAAWIQESRGVRGAIIDIRDNGGGSRLPLLTLLPHVLDADAQPVVVNAGKLKLPSVCLAPACEVPADGYLANRFMLPLRAIPEGSPERVALDAWLPGFEPRWVPPEEGFSDWHYLIVGPDPQPVFPGKPVVILMNNGNFSASDIFLSGFKGRDDVTLLGTASSGGSARRNGYDLPNSKLEVSLATLASFQAWNSELYDGVGIEPDIEMEAEPGFFVNASDEILEYALELIRDRSGGVPPHPPRSSP